MLKFSGFYRLRQKLDLQARINLPSAAQGTEYGEITSNQGTAELLAPGISLLSGWPGISDYLQQLKIINR